MKKHKSNQEWLENLKKVIEQIQNGKFKPKKKRERKKKEEIQQ